VELENQTPFPALLYSAADPNKEEHQIVVMKVSYKIVRKGNDQWDLELITDGSIPLCLADEFWGEVGHSSVKVESDLAPYKPFCDVILNGNAYTPEAKEMTAIAVRLKMSYSEPLSEIDKPREPIPLNPLMSLTESQKRQWQRDQEIYKRALKQQQHRKYITQLEKTLSVLGESEFKQNTLMPGWKRTSIKSFTQLPIRWDYAFGGHHHLNKSSDGKGITLYNEMCFTNPLGRGWVEDGYFDACEKVNSYRKKGEKIENFKTIAAPRIEYHMQRQPKPAIVKHPKKTTLTAKIMDKVSEQYPYQPAGFGFLGRPWSPRIALAGTYDEKWLEEQHPYPPQDTDYAYWNGAPKDQQIEFFYPNARLELWNLTKPEDSNKGYLKVDFLGHRPFIVMFFESGGVVPFPMITETVFIDTDNMIISLTHKAWIRSDTAPITKVEARFSDQAEGVLFEMAS